MMWQSAWINVSVWAAGQPRKIPPIGPKPRPKIPPIGPPVRPPVPPIGK